MDIRIPEHKGRWVASLSNGEIALEGKGKWKVIKDEASPWQRLQEYLVENGLKISSLKFQIEGQTYNVPSQRPRFTSVVPQEYNYFRKVIADISGNRADLSDRYVCLEAIYENTRLQLWISESDKNEAWLSVIGNHKSS